LIAARLQVRKMKGLGFAAARPLLRPAEDLGDEIPDRVLDRLYSRGYDRLVASPVKTAADAVGRPPVFLRKVEPERWRARGADGAS